MSISTSLLLSKPSKADSQSVISAPALKGSPVIVSPPTLLPTIPPMPKPSPLQELNFALMDLDKALEVAKRSSKENRPSHVAPILRAIAAVEEKMPKEEIDFSQEADWDRSRFYRLLWGCCYDIEEEPPVELPTEATRIFLEFCKKIEKSQSFRFPNINSKIGLDFGTCFGRTVAHVMQTIPQADEENARAGRFFETAYLVTRVQEKSQDPGEIGKRLLAHPAECSFIIGKVARILGYPKGKEMNLIDDVNHDKAPLPRMAIERMLGKLAKAAYEEISAQVKSNEELIKATITKRYALMRKNFDEHLQNSEKLVPEIQGLYRQICELKKQQFSYRLQLAFLDKTLAEVEKRKTEWDNIPEKILTRHKIRKGATILEKTPIKELSEKLKNLPDKNGKFELHLFSKTKEKDHSVYISFDPPCFSDINDTCHITGKQKIRAFNTVEELLVFLPDYLQCIYPEEYVAAELTRYEKIAT